MNFCFKNTFDFVSAYYFTPIVLTGCLSVLSGVMAAYCHHHQTSSDVPEWLCKFIKKVTTKKSFKAAKAYTSPTEQLFKGVEEIMIMDTTKADNDKEANCAKNSCSDREWELNWSEVAILLDRFFFITSLSITLISLFVTISLLIFL